MNGEIIKNGVRFDCVTCKTTLSENGVKSTIENKDASG